MFSKTVDFTEFLFKRSVSKIPSFRNYGNLLSHFFGKNLVKATFILKKLLNIHIVALTKYLIVRENFPFHHTMCVEISDYAAKSSVKATFSIKNFILRKLIWRKIFGIILISRNFNKNSVKSTFSLKWIDFTNNFSSDGIFPLSFRLVLNWRKSHQST